ncbi:MAG: hypothetical protein JST42_08595 [Bacteroidetes bacterium]|nr:hypothetical protein [Bacteroidota bacterium]
MQSFYWDKDFRHLVSGDLLHNRINLKWQPTSFISGALEARNRIFWGDQVAITPDFVDQLKNSSELVNMSKTWANRSNFIVHTNIERLWLEWRRQRWEVRAGRQRINWGIATLWNPNDIFNTYNFLDFDYEERPGSDAVKAAYRLNSMSGAEVAVAASNDKHRSIGALRLFTNRWNYDFQLISGWYKTGFIAGAGWAGSIKEAGFKGEVMYFAPEGDSAGLLNLTMEWDYMFKKGWYVNVGGLVNTDGLDAPVADWSKLNFNLSAKNILPVKWAAAVTTSKEITPLFSTNLSVIYSPGVKLFLLLPGLKYNLATNLDIDLIWQSFFADVGGSFEGVAYNGFLRLKWSF